MSELLLDIKLVNPSLHEQNFAYPGDFGHGRPNCPFMEFRHIGEWRDYLLTLQIKDTKVPEGHVTSYHAALRTLFLAWVEPFVIKAAESQVLASLEEALRAVFFNPLFEIKRAKNPTLKIEDLNKKVGLGLFLDHMVKHDQLSAMLHSESKRSTGSALDTIRNAIDHGNSMSTLPWGGLFESVRDVMTHAYRNHPEPPTYSAKIYAMMNEGMYSGMEAEDS
jgi:hypothetical protein